jgi:hypothetical protein
VGKRVLKDDYAVNATLREGKQQDIMQASVLPAIGCGSVAVQGWY